MSALDNQQEELINHPNELENDAFIRQRRGEFEIYRSQLPYQCDASQIRDQKNLVPLQPGDLVSNPKPAMNSSTSKELVNDKSASSSTVNQKGQNLPGDHMLTNMKQICDLKIRKPPRVNYPGMPTKGKVGENKTNSNTLNNISNSNNENFSASCEKYMEAGIEKPHRTKSFRDGQNEHGSKGMRWNMSVSTPKRANSALPKWSIPEVRMSIAENSMEEQYSERDEYFPRPWSDSRIPPDTTTDRQILDQIMIRVDDPEEYDRLDTDGALFHTSHQDIDIADHKSFKERLQDSQCPPDFKDQDGHSSLNKASNKPEIGSIAQGKHRLDGILDHSVVENPSSRDFQGCETPKDGGDITNRNKDRVKCDLFALETPFSRKRIQTPMSNLRRMLSEEKNEEQIAVKHESEDNNYEPIDLTLKTPKAFLTDNPIPYWQDPREYTFQSWNHLSSHHTIKAKRPAFLKRKEVQEQDFLPIELEAKKVLDNLPICSVVKDICLDYKYDPEFCFNSIADVVILPKIIRDPDQVSPIHVPTIRMEYQSRAWMKPKDSLYQTAEFPAYKQGKHIHQNNEHGEAASRHRAMKSKIAEQTDFIQKKTFLPLMDKQNAQALLDAEKVKLAEINKNLAGRRGSGYVRSVHPKKSLGKMHYVSDCFIDDFVELDSRHLYNSQNPVEQVVLNIQDSELEPEEFHQGLLARELGQNYVGTLNWSGEQVFCPKVYRKRRTDKVISSLNNQDLLIWLQGFKSLMVSIRKRIKRFVYHGWTDRFLMFCVLANTLILTLDGFTSENTQRVLTALNTAFTVIFAAELCMKIYALGFKDFIVNSMNIFDAVIVILSIVELVFNLAASASSSSGSALSAFRVLRIFRMFRVLRVTRLLRSMKFMKVIVAVIVETAEQYAYIAVILLLLIFIYTLLGMQIYAGNLFYKTLIPRTNFDTIGAGAWTLFQLLTFENWTDILEVLYQSSVNHSITILFVVSWIVVGNYIFFNLFLALLLGGFDSDNVVKQLEEEADEFKELQQVIKEQLLNEEAKLREFQSTHNQQSKQLEYILSSDQNKGIEDDELFLEVLPKKIRQSRGTYFLSRNTLNDESSLEDLLYPAIEIKTKIKPSFKLCDSRRNAYLDVHCETALYFFRKDNPARLLAARLASHRFFEPSVITLILISTMKLVIETYLDDIDDKGNVLVFFWLDIWINCCFILEMACKVLRNGFFMDKNSYLKDPWATLDFIVVVASIIDMMSPNESNLPYMKVLRTLRPLRFVPHYKQMKIIVNSLVGVLGPLLNVGVVVVLVWVIFSILGMNLVGGKLGYCDIQDYYGVDQAKCAIYGGTWKNPYWNFDNILESMMTLYVLTSLEGWPNLAASSFDASDGAGMAPNYDENSTMKLYFLVFILISAFFLLDLFTGVIFYQYGVELDREVSADCHNCTDEQIKWIMMQKMILYAEPNFNMLQIPKGKFRRFCYSIVNNWMFELGMLSVIFLNIVLLAMEHEWMSVSYETTLSDINIVLVFVYIGEFGIKFCAYLFSYYSDGWNCFDFTVVLISLIDFAINLVSQGSSTLTWASKVGKGFRVVRIVRVIKLFKSKEMQAFNKLIKTLFFCLPTIMNVLALLLMTYFIFAVLACFIFKGAVIGSHIRTDIWGFENFHQSLFTLFRCSTGEDWPTLMYIYGDSPGLYTISRTFFIVFVLLTTYIMMNLMQLVVVQIFENFYFDPKSALTKFNNLCEVFNAHWNNFTIKRGGQDLRMQDLVRFFAHLP